jgi:hypothetical protein
MRMMRKVVLDSLVVKTVIYIISLITKNGIDFSNCIILLLRQNGKYKDAAKNNNLSGPTLGDLFSSVLMLRSPKLLLLNY